MFTSNNPEIYGIDMEQISKVSKVCESYKEAWALEVYNRMQKNLRGSIERSSYKKLQKNAQAYTALTY